MGQVTVSLRQWHEQIDLAGLLECHDGLNIVPSFDSTLVVAGELPFNATGPDGTVIADSYTIRLEIPASFPDSIPSVWEVSERIPRDYHKLVGNKLCLGAPTQLRMVIAGSRSLLKFVEQLVVPYLYGHSYFERYQQMPFGELDHGAKGIRDFLRDLFDAIAAERPEEFLRLTSVRKRDANKKRCPCGSKRRLGRCHNRRVNHLRRIFGRRWFRDEYQQVLELMDE